MPVARARLSALVAPFRTSLPAPASRFYFSRGSVLFLSYCRFWESHGFVQQSLARLLLESGVEVTWLDGAGWRPYRPTPPFRSERLRIAQLPELPGRRLAALDSLSVSLQARWIEAWLRRSPGAVVWVQGGIDERLAAGLPRIDVFSTFDDPYRHDPQGPLCRKASLILAQNRIAFDRFAPALREKVVLAPPPVAIPESWERTERFAAPLRRGKPVAGYLGSFFPRDFDVDLFERLVRARPEIDFVLAGRTDAAGERWAAEMGRLPNFRRIPWAPRDRVPELWRSLDAALLLYRSERTQDGAFPVKIVESLHFGVPAAATRVPKTIDLEGIVPRLEGTSQWLQWIDRAAAGKIRVDEKTASFLRRSVDPARQLEMVAERLVAGRGLADSESASSIIVATRSA